MQNTEINDTGKPMDASEWGELIQQLTDPSTKQFCESQIEALSPLMKERAVRYQMSLKQPVVTCFVSNDLRDELQKADYIEGYCNEFFDFWTRPEHQTIFHRKKSSVESDKAESESTPELVDDSLIDDFSAHLNYLMGKSTPTLTTAKANSVVSADFKGQETLSEKLTTSNQLTYPKEELGKLGDAEFYSFYRALLGESEVKLSDDIEEPLTCLEIIGQSHLATFGTLGNFSLIIGKAKSRKTFLLSAIVAAAIKSDTIIGKIRGFLPDDKQTILYFDTEQHKGHVKRVLKRIATLANKEELPSIRVFQIKKYPPNHRLNAIRVAIEDSTNVGLIVIDGIRDLVFDINDAREATERATDLLRWTEEANAHLLTVIHENKGNNNARGHLGTELVNKAETVVSVSRDTNDKNVSIVTAEYCRDKEFEPFGFLIGEDGLPHLVDGVIPGNPVGSRIRKPTVDTMKSEEVCAIVLRAFMHDQQLRYSNLLPNIIEASEYVGVSLAKSRAEQFIRHVEALGYLTKFKPLGHKYEEYKINSEKLPTQLS